MDKLVEFGRKAMFYVRVLSGYEERRIRSFRLQLHKRIQEAEERKAALRKIPEQAILSEVRRMEAAIEDYFKPIDKEAEIMMDMQLKGEEKKMKEMKEMVKVMQEQALVEKAEQEQLAQASGKEATLHNNDKASNS
ncbi:transcription factor IIIB [Thalictrum thalictroides]|uniref:Transcription factor IIIB n=1 Tax=Thalictrum thalictroides TaxID=46969 RepID=A0A7J6VZA6_THATH|nr:transcription factor IIIB [Thalictrum thalictroides]